MPQDVPIYLSRKVFLERGDRFRRWGTLVLIACAWLFGSGCADRAIENAFKGQYSAVKNNKVINDYCQSCHIHKDFDASDHVSEVRQYYRKTAFRRTKQCRRCHYIEKNWIHNNYDRKTRLPRSKAHKRPVIEEIQQEEKEVELKKQPRRKAPKTKKKRPVDNEFDDVIRFEDE